MRYILESIRPEIRQYFIESDHDAWPYNRETRALVYQRAKNVDSTQSFGTRRNLYDPGMQWLEHSNLAPSSSPCTDAEMRTLVGPRCREPYSAALLNISAMSYGALSRNAVLALNGGAKLGGFYHNTGEGGVSPHHLEMGADVVWNVGTGYFGCRAEDGTFDEGKFKTQASHPHIKMIEVKLSQGAKPGHGGLLPASKLTDELAAIRGVPMGHDVHSPASHTAFAGADGLMKFMARLRDVSGKPVGFKMCVGSFEETVAMVRAMHDLQEWPDFITVDGAEGGTGAAPFEFSNRVGVPLTEGLVLVVDLLRGAGLRDKVRVIASGKIALPWEILNKMALGADFCNSARAMMFALGCIQALKCQTNKCPTGITTQDPDLMDGLVVPDKIHRVANYQKNTLKIVAELVASTGLTSPKQLTRHDVKHRISKTEVGTLANFYPDVPIGAFLKGQGPPRLQAAWDAAGASALKTT